MKSYSYLSNTYVPVSGIDEVEEYNNTIKAMHIMGMNNEDIISIVRTVSGVLQMGNLSFRMERSNDQATMPDNTGTSYLAFTLYKTKYFFAEKLLYLSIIVKFGK